ncbi:MAG: efflux RND transporter periplasmic adaptor subunit [Gemmatimonadaceae bacterium]|nr:efflux RND transporter periplasmic adaptor subunit [Gemmatimonadaceae bacterium]
MKKTSLAIGVTLACAVSAGVFWYTRSAEARNTPVFRFATVEQATLESTVSATGALSAVRTVQVGTQVSGQVAALYVDFNDKVRKGQLLARIDPTLQQQAVAESQAALERTEAQLAQAKAEYDRNKQLFESQVVTATEFATIQVTYRLAQSNVTSARIALQRTRQNLAYTSIASPIDGVIVSRAVELGQTVAASLSTPEIFRIAENLAEMQILALVDESDIGRIEVGQTATFTVAAFSTRTFNAVVKQKRLLSAVTDNVVNYTVVLGVANTDGKLLPGMTATVKFLTQRAENVLAVPNSALRFKPTAEMLGADSGILTARRDSLARRTAAAPPAVVAGGSGPGGPPPGFPGAAATPRVRRAAPDSVGTLWITDSTGRLRPFRVRTGVTDGQRTQVAGRAIAAGMQVAIGIATPGSAAAGGATANPFQPTQQRTGGPRPPGTF